MDSSIKIIFGFLWGTVQAADISFMLKAEEKAIIEAQNPEPQPQNLKNSTKLRLNGIVYCDSTSWAIWINGFLIKKSDKFDFLHILKVTPDHIEIIWHPPSNQQYQVSLRPNESFDRNHNKNISGTLID